MRRSETTAVATDGGASADTAAAADQALFESLPVGLYRATLDGRLLDANPALVRLLGYPSKAALLAADWRAIFFDADDAARVLERLRSERSLSRHEFRARSCHGNVFWARSSARLIPAPDGEAARFEGHLEDVIEAVRARELSRALVEWAPDGILIADGNGKILLVNSQLERIFGHSRDALLGQPMEILVPERWRGRHAGGRARFTVDPRARSTGAGLSLQGLRKDGTEFPLELSLSPLTTEEGALLVATARDVTERRAGEERLRRTEQQLAEAQRIASIGSWEWDARTNRFAWSAELLRIFDLAPETAGSTQRAFQERLHPEDRERVLEVVRTALARPGSYVCDHRIVRDDGSVRHVRSRGDVTFAGGEIARALGTCQDVTQQKLLEEELARARDQALQAANLKSAFLANMSHEIRTPLNVILGYNSLILQQFTDAGDHRHDDLLDGVARAGKRLLETISGILDLSRIESGAFDLKPEPLNLALLVERHLIDARALAQAKGLTLTFENDDWQATYVGDEYCLSHALLNLLNNAIKFTERGGVFLRLCRDAAGTPCLTIRDTGLGIDEAYLPHLFEPFSQEDAGYTRRFDGAGLGLALTKKYLEMNGCGIDVESRKGRGTTFIVRFANAAARSEGNAGRPPRASDRPPARAQERPTVLLVEDDAETQKYMAWVLQRRFNVVMASSGAEMRQLLAHYAPKIALVLMDISLKGSENGLALTRALRAGGFLAPIIAVTAHAFADDRLRALEAGCDAYLAKPVNPRELVASIENVLGAAARHGTDDKPAALR